MQLEKKLVVITGSGRGIGRAMAIAFAQKHANVALLDLNEADLAQTRSQCEALGVEARSYLCNVASEDDMSVVVVGDLATVRSQLGGVKALQGAIPK